jgi:hypothetical protein
MPIKINKELKYLGKLKEDTNKLVILYCPMPLPISDKAVILGEQVINFSALQSPIWKKI